MRPLVIIGIVLIVLGIIGLAIPSFTYFTQERVADAGFFKVDVDRPHTIVINPIAGVLAIVAGLVLVVVGRKTSSA